MRSTSVNISRLSCTHQEALWSAVKTGLVDMVVSDHSPCTLDLKKPGVFDFMEAWGGIASVQFGEATAHCFYFFGTFAFSELEKLCSIPGVLPWCSLLCGGLKN